MLIENLLWVHIIPVGPHISTAKVGYPHPGEIWDIEEDQRKIGIPQHCQQSSQSSRCHPIWLPQTMSPNSSCTSFSTRVVNPHLVRVGMIQKTKGQLACHSTVKVKSALIDTPYDHLKPPYDSQLQPKAIVQVTSPPAAGSLHQPHQYSMLHGAWQQARNQQALVPPVVSNHWDVI